MNRGVYFRNGIAYIRFKDGNGKIMRESTEQRSRKFALDLLAKRKTEVAEGRHFPTRQFDRVMFDELLDDWWEKHGKQTRSRFNYHLPRVRERFGGKRARDIQPDQVEAFLKDLEHELAASTINKYRTILCSTFNFAIRREKFDRNPVRVVPQRKEPPGRDRFLPPEDFRKLIDECRAEPALYAFVWLAATTGARKSEILRRKWSEIELEGSASRVHTAIEERSPQEIAARGGCHPRPEETAELRLRRICISGRPVQRPLQRDAGARLGHAQALPGCVRTCRHKEPQNS